MSALSFTPCQPMFKSWQSMWYPWVRRDDVIIHCILLSKLILYVNSICTLCLYTTWFKISSIYSSFGLFKRNILHNLTSSSDRNIHEKIIMKRVQFYSIAVYISYCIKCVIRRWLYYLFINLNSLKRKHSFVLFFFNVHFFSLVFVFVINIIIMRLFAHSTYNVLFQHINIRTICYRLASLPFHRNSILICWQ